MGVVASVLLWASSRHPTRRAPDAQPSPRAAQRMPVHRESSMQWGWRAPGAPSQLPGCPLLFHCQGVGPVSSALRPCSPGARSTAGGTQGQPDTTQSSAHPPMRPLWYRRSWSAGSDTPPVIQMLLKGWEWEQDSGSSADYRAGKHGHGPWGVENHQKLHKEWSTDWKHTHVTVEQKKTRDRTV